MNKLADSIQAGSLLQDQGRYEEAKEIFERYLAIEEQVIGKDSFTLYSILNHLALNYRFQGKYDEAMGHYNRWIIISSLWT